MGPFRSWLALGLVLGLSGCASQHQRLSGYGPTTRTVPTGRATPAKEPVDPFDQGPRMGAGMSRYFPGLGKLAFGGPEKQAPRLETDPIAERLAATPEVTTAEAPSSRKPIGSARRFAEPAPLLPVALKIEAYPDQSPASIDPAAREWRAAGRKAPRPVQRDGATRRARAELESASASAELADERPMPPTPMARTPQVGERTSRPSRRARAALPPDPERDAVLQGRPVVATAPPPARAQEPVPAAEIASATDEGSDLNPGEDVSSGPSAAPGVADARASARPRPAASLGAGGAQRSIPQTEAVAATIPELPAVGDSEDLAVLAPEPAAAPQRQRVAAAAESPGDAALTPVEANNAVADVPAARVPESADRGRPAAELAPAGVPATEPAPPLLPAPAPAVASTPAPEAAPENVPAPEEVSAPVASLSTPPPGPATGEAPGSAPDVAPAPVPAEVSEASVADAPAQAEISETAPAGAGASGPDAVVANAQSAGDGRGSQPGAVDAPVAAAGPADGTGAPAEDEPSAGGLPVVSTDPAASSPGEEGAAPTGAVPVEPAEGEVADASPRSESASEPVPEARSEAISASIGRERPRMRLTNRNGIIMGAVTTGGSSDEPESLATYAPHSTREENRRKLGSAAARDPRREKPQARKPLYPQPSYVVADLPPVQFPKAYYTTASAPRTVETVAAAPRQAPAAPKKPSRFYQFRVWLDKRFGPAVQ